MIRSLVVKELRECLIIAAVAGLAYLATYLHATGSRVVHDLPILRANEGPPFLGDGFAENIGAVGFFFALALGLWQTGWESYRGTFLFLFHRPMTGRAILRVKLATGIVLLLGLTAAPIAIYGQWAATSGNHPSPFEWSMTYDAWAAMAALPAVYLGAFLSAIRPARIWGTRLLPGMAALLAASVIAWLTANAASLIVVALAACFLLFIAIEHAATTRDYA